LAAGAVVSVFVVDAAVSLVAGFESVELPVDSLPVFPFCE
jgi:hypothetical protein